MVKAACQTLAVPTTTLGGGKSQQSFGTTQRVVKHLCFTGDGIAFRGRQQCRTVDILGDPLRPLRAPFASFALKVLIFNQKS